MIHVIEGKPTASAALISTLVRRASHKLRVTGDDTRAVATIRRCDDPDFEFRSEWTLERAIQAGLVSKKVWQQFPAAMLKARAITEVSRDACQEALCGVQYTPEELGRDVDLAGAPMGNVEEAEWTIQDPPAPADHPLRARLVESLKTRFGDDKAAAGEWLKGRCPRTWSALTEEDLAGLVEALKPVPSTEVAQAEPEPAQPQQEPSAPTTEQNDRRRKPLQQRWAILRQEKGLDEHVAYWWAQEQFGWFFDPAKGRASANLTPVPQIEACVKTLASLTPDLVERIRDDYAYWLDAQRLAGEASDG